MADPQELFPNVNPVEVLSQTIEFRQAELDVLLSQFGQAMEIVEDTNIVNEVLGSSSRPDLVITEPAKMMEANDVADVARVNNFKSLWTSFGAPIWEEEASSYIEEETETKVVGYRDATSEELEALFFMGARGEFKDEKAFAESFGMDEEVVDWMSWRTHISKPAFMRMWIVFPELTHMLMTRCLDRPKESHMYIRPDRTAEYFVAYNVMSRLVDAKDLYVVRDGEVDDWYLCR